MHRLERVRRAKGEESNFRQREYFSEGKRFQIWRLVMRIKTKHI